MERQIYPRDIQRLRTKLRQTQDQLDAKKKEFETLQKEIRDVEQALSIKKSEMTTLQNELRRKKFKEPQMKRQIISLERAWRQLDDEVRKMR